MAAGDVQLGVSIEPTLRILTKSGSGDATLELVSAGNQTWELRSLRASNALQLGQGTFPGAITIDAATGHIGVGAVPGASMGLDLPMTDGALVVPRMTTAQRDALTAANGMIIYNTTTATMQGRVAGAWVNL